MILLTGATGLVGRATAEILQTGRRPWTELSLTPRDASWNEGPRTVVACDVTDAQALLAALPAVRSIIHLVGVPLAKRPLRADHERAAMEALLVLAKARGVERFIYLSASGAASGSGHAWLRAKGDAEQLLRASGVPFIILRASLITSPDAPVVEALRFAVSSGAKLRLPLLRSGRVQPLAAGDVAIALATALDHHRMVGETIEVGRSPPLSLEELLQQIALRLGKKLELTKLPIGGYSLEEALAAVAHTQLTDVASFVRLFALLEPAPVAPFERLIPMRRATFFEEIREFPWGAPQPRSGERLPTVVPPENSGLPLFIPGENLRRSPLRGQFSPGELGRVDPFGRPLRRGEQSANEGPSGGSDDPAVAPPGE